MERQPGLRDLPGGVWALGLVSLFMDTSSEMIHALLPLFLVDALGTGTAALGLIEGVAEATAAVTRLFSGALSDRIGRRKWLVVFGYGLAAATKPVFALAGSAGVVLAARFVDRVGKGIRGAPRDALLADLAPPALRGAAFGLRQGLDSVGACIGPLLAVLLMHLLGGRFRAALAWAVLPALAAVAVAVLGVRESRAAPLPRQVAPDPRGLPVRRADLAQLGAAYWRAVAIGTLFTLARFSEAFLVLKAQAAGLSPALAPAVLAVMNLVYAGLAAPAGAASDRIGRLRLLGAGMLTLAGADAVLAGTRGLAGLLAGAALWGAHMALTQGLLSALVADALAPPLRGTGFGLFSLITGGALLLASVAAGLLWQQGGAALTFAAGAVLALGATAALSAGCRHA